MKRLCALALCLVLMLPPALAASEPVWPRWAEDSLAWGREQNVGQGLLDSPEDTVTRGMAAQLLYETAGRPAASGSCPFSDVSEHRDAVAWPAQGMDVMNRIAR